MTLLNQGHNDNPRFHLSITNLQLIDDDLWTVLFISYCHSICHLLFHCIVFIIDKNICIFTVRYCLCCTRKISHAPYMKWMWQMVNNARIGSFIWIRSWTFPFYKMAHWLYHRPIKLFAIWMQISIVVSDLIRSRFIGIFVTIRKKNAYLQQCRIFLSPNSITRTRSRWTWSVSVREYEALEWNCFDSSENQPLTDWNN